MPKDIKFFTASTFPFLAKFTSVGSSFDVELCVACKVVWICSTGTTLVKECDEGGWLYLGSWTAWFSRFGSRSVEFEFFSWRKKSSSGGLTTDSISWSCEILYCGLDFDDGFVGAGWGDGGVGPGTGDVNWASGTSRCSPNFFRVRNWTGSPFFRVSNAFFNTLFDTRFFGGRESYTISWGPA